jgi:hypothetical protein
MEMSENDKINEVMDKVEEFYFGDGDDSGEAIFNKFAEKHAHLFTEECDAIGQENKLE